MGLKNNWNKMLTQGTQKKTQDLEWWVLFFKKKMQIPILRYKIM